MTTEKMLAFANDMKDIYKSKVSTDGMNTEEEKVLASIFPDFKRILDTISELQSDIEYSEVKKNGRGGERSRTAAAKKFLETIPESRIRSLYGYKEDEESGDIVLCNTYMMFKGDKIIGIPEVSKPESYFDYKNTIGRFEEYFCLHENDGVKLDIVSIKTNFKIAKTEKGGKKVSDALLYTISDSAVVSFDIADEEKVYFNAYLIILACGMIGGSDYTIHLGANKFSPCKIVGDRGITYICSFNKKY